MKLSDVDLWLTHWGRAHRAHEPLHLRRKSNPNDRSPFDEAPVELSPFYEAWIPHKNWDTHWGEPPPPETTVWTPNPEWVAMIDAVMPRMQVRHRRWLTKWYVQLRGDVTQEMLLSAQLATLYKLDALASRPTTPRDTATCSSGS